VRALCLLYAAIKEAQSKHKGTTEQVNEKEKLTTRAYSCALNFRRRVTEKSGSPAWEAAEPQSIPCAIGFKNRSDSKLTLGVGSST
jgi:hypothetical protein